jgi:hypothetical protein
MNTNLKNINPIHVSLDRVGIEEVSENLIEAFKNGELDALEMDCKLKFAEESIKASREKIKPYVMKKEIGSIHELFGCKVSKRNGYAILDFEQDAEYAMLKKQLDERKALLSQSFKTVHNVVTEQGEIVPKLPVKSYTSDSISYTFKK